MEGSMFWGWIPVLLVITIALAATAGGMRRPRHV